MKLQSSAIRKAAQRLAEVKAKPQHRRADLGAVDLQARTVELAFSSEIEYRRPFGIEILGHGPGEVRMSRLQNGGAVLWNHDHSDMRGKVETARIDADRKGRAVIRLSKSAAGEQLLQDIIDGIVTKVSVGYSIYAWKVIEERADVDVFYVTDWEPYEISLVSIPADDTVGVGRSAENPPQEQWTRTAQNGPVKQPEPRMHQLSEQIISASRALGFHDHIPAGFVVPNARSAVPPVVAGNYRLSELLPKLPVSKQEQAAYAGLIDARKSANSISIKAAIMEQSRVAQAGAQLLIYDHAARPIPGTDLYENPKEGVLRLVKPAPFSQVVDGADVATSPYPVEWEYFHMGDAPNTAVRFELNRREQKDLGEDRLTFELVEALTKGIAREMDRVLLQSIAERPNLPTFSYGAAAAKGLKFEDLRALVGKDGGGATVNASGNLVANGVSAELTDTVAETIFGAFNAAAVAVVDDIQILIERRDARGNLQVTVFLNTMAVLPDPTLFWKLA